MSKAKYVLNEIERGSLKGVALDTRAHISGDNVFVCDDGLPGGHKELLEAALKKAQGITGGHALLYHKPSMLKNSAAKEMWNKLNENYAAASILGDIGSRVFNHPVGFLVCLQGEQSVDDRSLLLSMLADLAKETGSFFRIVLHDESQDEPLVAEPVKTIDEEDCRQLSRLLAQSGDVLDFLKSI